MYYNYVLQLLRTHYSEGGSFMVCVLPQAEGERVGVRVRMFLVVVPEFLYMLLSARALMSPA